MTLNDILEAGLSVFIAAGGVNLTSNLITMFLATRSKNQYIDFLLQVMNFTSANILKNRNADDRKPRE